MRIIVATGNKGKIREIRQMLHEFEVISHIDLGFNDNIEENGLTFHDNAIIKARAVYDLCHREQRNACFLADDSGLEIQALNGKPGVFSARYAGENATQDMLIGKVLDEMKGVPDENRRARFICVMALMTSGGKIHTVEGACSGSIARSPTGGNGFGYDPIFQVEKYGFKKTMAELSDNEKNTLSHRYFALEGIRKIILDLSENK